MSSPPEAARAGRGQAPADLAGPDVGASRDAEVVTSGADTQIPERTDVAEAFGDLTVAERDDLVSSLHREHVEATVRAELAAEAQRRLSNLADDLAAEFFEPQLRRPPMRMRYPRWGWRRAIRHAVQRRMYTPQYLNLYRRYLWHRLDRALHFQRVEFQGLVFTGKRVEFHARRGHGRLVVGPWCWIGNDNKLRAHEGQLTLGPKVVMGRDNVINTYLDIEIGEASILADWIYICDFDHRFDRLDLPIKDQGIAKSPVRVGADVWIGEKATVLRGVDIGRGSVVASHCLVNQSLPPFSIAVGVPVRVVKSRLPDGMDAEEAAALLRLGRPLPGDPLEG